MNQKVKTVSIYILGVLSTPLVVFSLQIIHSRFFERPDISARLQSLVFTEGEKDEWKVTLYLRVSNSGQSPAAIEYGQLELYVPTISQRPLLFDFKKILNISSNTAIDDTLTSRFLKFFNSPTFKNGQIELHSLKGKLLAKAVFDSSDVKIRWVLTRFNKPIFELKNELKEARYDSTAGLLKLAVKRYTIDYQGKSYVNFVYPRNAEVEHRIVDNRIKLNYSIIGGLLKVVGGSSSSWTPEPIQFFSHPEISDKIDYPELMEAIITIERRKSNSIEYESFKLFLDKNSTQYVYIFKEID